VIKISTHKLHLRYCAYVLSGSVDDILILFFYSKLKSCTGKFIISWPWLIVGDTCKLLTGSADNTCRLWDVQTG